jgi:chloramphenicol-sensitive protein RarD
MIATSRASSLGFLYAVLAYASWGVFPIYWKFFGRVSPLEVISHRVVWSLVLMFGLTMGTGQWKELREVLGDGRRLGVLLLTASLLSVNWGIFVYGVVNAHIVQTSLGYFLNPLFSVLLGLVFLKERLNR